MQMKVKNLFKEKKKCANESSESRTKRLATQSQYQRQKFANELAQCREDCSTNVNIRKKILKMDQQTILDKRDWQTSINIRMRKMYIVQLLLIKSENFMLLSRVHLLFINQFWYKHSVITAENLRFSNHAVEKY